jgi:integrase
MTAVNEHPGIHHLPPSLRFPKGGWEVRWRNAEGASRRKTFETKKHALNFQRAKLTDVRRGTDHEESPKTFREVAEDWYAGLTDLKPKTLEGYRYTLDRYILPALGSKRIGRVKPPVLRAFLAGLPTKLSPTTRRNIFRTLTPILNQALADGLIQSNPAKLVKLPKAKATEKPSKSSMPTAEQVTALAELMEPEYRSLVYFAAYTGMRAGEIVALRVRNLDLMRGRVTVEESVTAVATKFTGGTRLVTGTPKSGASRSFAIPRFLVEMVMEQVAGKGTEDFVFPAPSGGVLRHSWFFERHYRPAVDRLIAEGTWPRTARRFHDLRHTCASLLIAQGVHPKAIQERLGHSSIMVTMDIYGHLYDDHEDAMMAGLQDAHEKAQAALAARSEATVVPLR